MVFEKRPPGLRRRLPRSDHVFGDRRLEYVNAQLEQFTVYSWGSAGGIGNAHFPDEFSDLSFSIGSSWATALPAPIKTKTPTMPANDCFQLDDQ
jgi:hypothetical protein